MKAVANLLRGSWMDWKTNFNRLTVCHPWGAGLDVPAACHSCLMLNIFLSASFSLSALLFECGGASFMVTGHMATQHWVSKQHTAGISTVQVYVCSAWANMETAQHTRAVCFFFFVSFLEDVLKELFHINAANGGGVTTHQENARCFIFQEAQPFLYVGPGSKIWFHFWGQQTVKTSESKSKVGGVK